MRQERAKGFTLVELMVILCIIGITSAVAIPYFVGQMPRYRLNGAARQIMGDLMLARMKAVSQMNEFKVFFLNDHEYRVLDDDDGDGSVDGGEWTETKDIHQEYHDVTISSTNDPIFHPRGTATNWATITITNTSGTKAITVSATGRVKII